MRLTFLSVKNFRCYENLQAVPLHPLTVFIGENDAGKTVLLDAVRILLTDARPDKSDFRQISKGQYAQEISLTAVFALQPFDVLPADWCPADKQTFTLVKTFELSGSSRIEVFGQKLKDARFKDFANLDAGNQKQLLEESGQTAAANKEGRIAQVNHLIENGVIGKENGLLAVSLTALLNYLPIFELTSATDYEHPHLLVQKTLQTVVNSCIKQASANSDEPPELIPELRKAHDLIEESLNSKLAEAKEALKAIHPKVKEVFASPRIDFAKSVQIPELLLDCDDGQGAKPLSSFGDGTKKRMWMGLLDWQRQTEKAAENTCIIRAYDEPDMSLHYEAQRKLFSNMVSAVVAIDSRTQVLVCTHSLALVDRAPGESINLIQVSEDSSRNIDYLKGSGDDQDVKTFLNTVGRSIGISNSALFYERVFLIVEGESEENALPILYKNLFHHSLLEDGIVLINLSGSGAWRPFLKLLSKNRASTTLLLLDTDCKSAASRVRVTPERLNEVGFPSEFLKDNSFHWQKGIRRCVS